VGSGGIALFILLEKLFQSAIKFMVIKQNEMYGAPEIVLFRLGSIDQIPAELIHAKVKTLCSLFYKHIHFL
jgi:hypothetical protein